MDDDEAIPTTSDIARVVDKITDDEEEFISGGESRYGRRTDAERSRIEHRASSFADYDDARIELLGGQPVAIRQVLRDRNHQTRGLMRRIKDAALGILRLPGAKEAPIGLSARERLVLEEMWRFWVGLSPSDSEQFEEFFIAAGREHARAPSYLCVSLTRTGKGVQRGARQDWSLPTEMRRHAPPAE